MKAFKYSIRTKILGFFIVLTVVYALLLVVNVVRMRHIVDRLHAVDEAYVPMLSVANNLKGYYHLSAQFSYQQLLRNRDQRLFANTVRYTYPQLVASDIEALVETMRQERLGVDRLSRTDGARIMVSIAQVKGFAQQYHELLARLIGQGSGAASPTLFQERRQQLVAAINQLNGRIHGSLQRQIRRLAEVEQRDSVAIGLVGLCVFLLALVMMRMLWTVLRPIKVLTVGARRISQGDNGYRVQVRSKDEIGQLAEEFNSMAASVEQREAQLRSLTRFNESIVQSMRSGLLVCDADGAITFHNAAFDSMVDHPQEKVQSWTGAQIGELPFTPPLALSSTDRKEPLQCSYGQRTIAVRSMPLTDADHQRVGTLYLFDDVTEEIEMKSRLLQSERLAVVGQMSSKITHEIKNPLHSLGLNLELLSEELNSTRSPEAERIIRTLENEVSRLNKVSEGYLQFARGSRASVGDIWVNHVFEEIMLLMQEELKQNKIELDIDTKKLQRPLLGDSDHLKQALINLIRNAMEAINLQEGNGRARISLSAYDHDNSVIVAVDDSGPGACAEDAANMFKPFYTTKPSGTGLGLVLTQDIVNNLGGTISCEASRLGGLRFTMTLPAAESTQQVEEHRESSTTY